MKKSLICLRDFIKILFYCIYLNNTNSRFSTLKPGVLLGVWIKKRYFIGILCNFLVKCSTRNILCNLTKVIEIWSFFTQLNKSCKNLATNSSHNAYLHPCATLFPHAQSPKSETAGGWSEGKNKPQTTFFSVQESVH